MSTGGGGPGTALRRLPEVLAAATALLQVAWVLASGAVRDALTVAGVAAFFAASASHALAHRGPRWAAAYVAAAGGVGFAAEAVGVRTGWPFGEYAYAGTLGPQPAGVPVVVALAWAAAAYPCLLAARRLSASPVAVPVLGAVLLASWDLFLDPQMVAEGHWAWAHPEPALPGIPGIPVGNYLGWLLTAAVIMVLLDRLPRPAPGWAGQEAAPVVLLGWLFAGNVLAAAVFFGRPGAAVWGGAAMGAVVVPWAVAVVRDARGTPPGPGHREGAGPAGRAGGGPAGRRAPDPAGR